MIMSLSNFLKFLHMALLSLSFLYTLSLKMFSVDFVLLFTPFTVTILSHRYRKLLFTDFLMILPVSSQNSTLSISFFLSTGAAASSVVNCFLITMKNRIRIRNNVILCRSFHPLQNFPFNLLYTSFRCCDTGFSALLLHNNNIHHPHIPVSRYV